VGVLYLMMGLALAMVLSARGAPGRPGAVAAFIVQLLLNLAWSPVFFALHRMVVAQGIILALIPLVALTCSCSGGCARRRAGSGAIPCLGMLCRRAQFPVHSGQSRCRWCGCAAAAVRVNL
jgi:hypothetical protein